MNIETLNKYYIDRDSRTIYIFYEINEVSACFIIKSLLEFELSSGTITLMINSPGGNITDGNAIIDTILSLKNPVDGHVVGEACSMAVDILLACDNRYISTRSNLLIHNGSAVVDGDMISIKNSSDAIQRDLKRSVEFYLTRIKISKSKLNKLLSADSILDAKTALKYGFVDKIIENTKALEK